MNISVIGCGRWGTFIAYYLNSISHKVTIYGRPHSSNFTALALYRRNEYVTLPEGINLTSDISEICDSDVVVISIPSHGLRNLCEELNQYNLRNKIIVLCMKGLEVGTCLRLSEIVKDVCDPSNKIAVWVGPGHPEDFYRGVPSCMVIDSENESIKYLLIREFSSDLVRFYYGSDMIGNEVGAALKNVIGIAAGVLDGLNMTSLKGPLMSRGAKEVSLLISAMGGNAVSAYGLCHLGDYEATLFSERSHNRCLGEAVVAGDTFSKLAEGYYTAKAVIGLCDKYGIEMPVCRGVYDILYNKIDAKLVIDRLFKRKVANEFPFRYNANGGLDNAQY